MSKIKKLLMRIIPAVSSTSARLSFRCNICGGPAESAIQDLDREMPTCQRCGSTVRMRALIHLLSIVLFERSIALHEFPVRKDISVLDMSGWEEYGSKLGKKLDYTNTYYHKDPRLDITDIDSAWEGRFDVIISSDVFEHVIPPVSVAFENTLKLLKPGGTLILTVPYTKEQATLEHFPELHEFEILKDNGRHILKNITEDGKEQVFDDLVFHGGPGSTLEMRVFAENPLRNNLSDVGFTDIIFRREPHYDFGVMWLHDWSLPLTARRP